MLVGSHFEFSNAWCGDLRRGAARAVWKLGRITPGPCRPQIGALALGASQACMGTSRRCRQRRVHAPDGIVRSMLLMGLCGACPFSIGGGKVARAGVDMGVRAQRRRVRDRARVRGSATGHEAHMQLGAWAALHVCQRTPAPGPNVALGRHIRLQLALATWQLSIVGRPHALRSATQDVMRCQR